MNNKKTITHTSSPALEDLLFALRRKVIDSMRKDALSYELTLSQSEALRIIGTHEPQTMKSIADALKITPPSTTALIEEMERKGLVVREKDAHDRRVVSIRLSAKAQRLFSRVCVHKKAVVNRMFKKLSAQDRKTLERIIGIIISK
jgi:DNA-binding MarR family transcriptional regulator